MDGRWTNCEELQSKIYTCGICDKEVSSNKGYTYTIRLQYEDRVMAYMYICHNCKAPTYFPGSGLQIPGKKYGGNISHLPEEVEVIYEEARKCFSVNAFTSAVLCCRKLLMNISCEKGAKPGGSFEFYVDYLNDNGYIPPDGRQWVDKIRKLGNQATHKLEVKSQADAVLAIKFTSMLLKFVYEFPKLLEV